MKHKSHSFSQYFSLIGIIPLLFCCFFAITQTKSNNNTFAARSDIVVNDIISGNNGLLNNEIFSGTVTKIDDEIVSYYNDNGEISLRKNTIIHVIVDDVYKGNISKPGKELKILNIYGEGSPNINIDNTILINKGDKYIFINSWDIDDKYYAYCSDNGIELNSEETIVLDKADIIMGGAWCSLLPIENETVFIHQEYVKAIEAEQNVVLPTVQTKSDLLISDGQSSEYVAISIDIFENIFSDYLFTMLRG